MLCQPILRPLRRTALLLTTALLLSGCIFGEEEVEEVIRPPAVFTAQTPNQFTGKVQDELSYREDIDPLATSRMRQAIREIVALSSLQVAPESYMADVPGMPDISGVDPISRESLEIVYSELGDLLKGRGVMLEEMEAKAVELRNAAAKAYAEAAKVAISMLDESRNEILERRSQVQSVAGQLAFVKPNLSDWIQSSVRLSGQIINLSPVELSELGLEVISLQPTSSRTNRGRGDDDEGAVQADMIMKFTDPLRPGETRTLKGYELSLDGDAPADPSALSGSVVVSITHVTMTDGTTLTGEEYEPALEYLDKLESEITDFVSEVPEALTRAVEESQEGR